MQQSIRDLVLTFNNHRWSNSHHGTADIAVNCKAGNPAMLLENEAWGSPLSISSQGKVAFQCATH
jgi:hypothetical protein